MKCLLLGLWTWALLVLMGSGRSMGCLEEERNALLNIEAAIYPLNGSSFLLWRYNSSDCCRWKGVECNYTTSRVIGLYLGDACHSELEVWCGETGESRPWDIDASLFLPLEELQVLDLSRNFLSVGWTPGEGGSLSENCYGQCTMTPRRRCGPASKMISSFTSIACHSDFWVSNKLTRLIPSLNDKQTSAEAHKLSSNLLEGTCKVKDHALIL